MEPNEVGIFLMGIARNYQNVDRYALYQDLKKVFLAGCDRQSNLDNAAIMLTKKERTQSAEGHIDWLIKMDDALASIQNAKIKEVSGGA